MAILHDSSVRSAIEARLHALRPDSKPRWGKMSVDQMVWHVNQAMASALGHIDVPQDKSPIPRGIMKYMVLKLPWVKNAPTNPSFLARARHDFAVEKARCLDLIKTLADRPLEKSGTVHPMFGRMSGHEVSQLQAKHLDHHLKQFGV